MSPRIPTFSILALAFAVWAAEALAWPKTNSGVAAVNENKTQKMIWRLILIRIQLIVMSPILSNRLVMSRWPRFATKSRSLPRRFQELDLEFLGLGRLDEGSP